jgi:hypothetical protein
VRAQLLILAVLLLAGCGARPAPDDAGAIRAVEQFVAALEARDASAIIDLIEPSDWRREIGPELRTYLAYMSSIELRDPTYSVQENDGQRAIVRAVGTLAYTLAEGGASGERPADLMIELVQVDDTWYLRQLQLPQP